MLLDMVSVRDESKSGTGHTPNMHGERGGWVMRSSSRPGSLTLSRGCPGQWFFKACCSVASNLLTLAKLTRIDTHHAADRPVEVGLVDHRDVGLVGFQVL